jgi:signal peptidase I
MDYKFIIFLGIIAVLFLLPGKKNSQKIDTPFIKVLIEEWIEPLLSAFILALLIITFTAQAFRIPSGSMKPTLEINDRILANKFIYKFTKPKVGDIIIFICPDEIGKDYIKRLIAGPGDIIQMKELPEGTSLGFSRIGSDWTLNGQLIPNDGNPSGLRATLNALPISLPDKFCIKKINGIWKSNKIEITDDLAGQLSRLRALYLNHKRLEIYPQIPSGRCYYNPVNKKNYRKLEEGLEIPEGQYFALGDNSDNSRDSRYWGFVPGEYIKGRAFFTFWPLDRFHKLY